MSRVLYLIRHGRSDFGAKDTTLTSRGPQWDPPLDEIGREQAEKLARRLRMMDRPAAVYCSTLRRARETVRPFAEGAGLDVVYDEDLAEAHGGSWEGKPFEEILASDEEIMQRFRNQEPIWAKAPGAERLGAFRARVRAAIDRTLERHTEGDVFVVCHGGVINAFVAPILGIDHEMFFLPENTSVNSVVIDGAERHVRFLNDVLHLTDPHLFE